MDPTARALEKETRKWLERLKKELNKHKPESMDKDKKVSAVLKNMQAYIDDCQHFLEKKDFIRAFEAVVYAWGIWETLHRCNLIKS